MRCHFSAAPKTENQQAEPQPVKRTVKKYKVFPASSQALLAAFMRRDKVRAFHRHQDTQIALDTSRVVIANILLDHLDKFVLAGKPSAVIAFPLQNAPEALHRTVVNTMRHTGHTLRHARLYELVVESAVGVLEPSVAVEQRLCVRIGLHRFVEGFENQRIIVAFAEYIGHNTPVTEIQNALR